MIKFAITFLILFLSACSSSMQIEEFQDKEPKLILEQYFAGKTRGWAIVQDRAGKILRQFSVDIDGRWDGKTLTLNEDFLYADGETQNRVWKIEKLSNNKYSGTADDVIDKATGIQQGNALNWSYVLKLPVDSSVYNITFDDWMFLQPDGVLINRATMSKFGFTVGEVLIFFKKDSF